MLKDESELNLPGRLAKIDEVYEVTGQATTCTQTANGCIYPMNVKVFGMNGLPSITIDIGSAAWNKAVQDGVIKAVDTGSIMTGYNTRPIVWMVFQNTSQNTFCTTPVYKDDGSAIGNYTRAGSVCNTESWDWAMGTSDGIIRHSPTRNQCYQFQWGYSSLQHANTFLDLLITCPQ